MLIPHILTLAQTLTFHTKDPEAASPFYWIPFVVLAVAILIALITVIRDNRGKLWERDETDG
jgi:hypothetical protein